MPTDHASRDDRIAELHDPILCPPFGGHRIVSCPGGLLVTDRVTPPSRRRIHRG